MGKVNVQARIIARKITFSFVYSHIFLFNLKKTFKEDVDITPNNKVLLENKNKDKNGFISNMFVASDSNDKDFDENNCFFCFSEKNIDKYYLEEVGEYILDQYFSYKKTPVFDMDYFLQVASKVFSYKDEVFSKINQFTSTFSIERMDVSDQCIFMIAYTEWKVLGTPKEVLLNEMIELAKRYGDEGSPKLVNGILHKIIS